MPRARASAEPSYSLGWELEATHGARITPAGVIRDRDGSVHGQGIEYKTSVDLITRIPENLEALRQLVADPELHVDRSCGFHVHIGLAGRVTALQRQQWAGNFVLLARAVEESAFAAVPESRRTNSFCRRWMTHNAPITGRSYSANKYANAPYRYQWVNIVEMFRPGGIQTVEIRLAGNVKRYAYLLGWIGACHSMARAAWSMIADPTAFMSEAERLNRMFLSLASSLLRPSTNEIAYAHAVELARRSIPAMSQHGRDYLTTLLGLANPSENQRLERVANAERAHSMALEIQIDLCHTEALAENHERRRIGWERVSRERIAAENAQHERAERARRVTRPVVAVMPLTGFNPDAFTIRERGN